MTPLVTLPHPLTDGTTAFGSQVKANDDAIVAVVNANIDDANIKTGAQINGSKLSNVAGSRVPTDRIEDDAVTFDKLRDDATVDANRAVNTNHVRDGAITAAKIGALAVVLSKVKTAFFDWAPGGILGAGASNSISTGITTATGIPLRIEIRRAGPPDGTVAINCIFQLWLNTATNTYHLSIGANGNLFDTTGLTFRMTYIPVS